MHGRWLPARGAPGDGNGAVSAMELTLVDYVLVEKRPQAG